MVTIPAGEFEMGSNDAEARKQRTTRAYRLRCHAFYMDETEVTNTQFKAFLLENPQLAKGTR